MPTVVFSLTAALALFAWPLSQRMETKYFPVAVLLMVACFIAPFIGRCSTILIPSLNLGMDSLPSSIMIFWGMLKDCVALLFLNFGKLALSFKELCKSAIKVYNWLLQWLAVNFFEPCTFLFQIRKLFNQIKAQKG